MTLATVALGETISVGLGEIKVSDVDFYILVAFGLGSCVAVCAYDPQKTIGGMAHIVLPGGDHQANERDNPGKFATIGVPYLIAEMERLGASRRRIAVKIAGGSQMAAANGFSDRFAIGERNIRAVKSSLADQSIRLVAEDIGGHYGRTVQLILKNGAVLVRAAGGDTRRL